MSGTAVTYNNSSLISASYTYRQTDSTGTIEYNDSEDTSPETGTTVYETTQVRDYAVTAGNTTTTYRFEYDPNGNITSISDGTYTTSYEYDTLGQLTKESNRSSGKIWQYSYDSCGNILSKTEYDYSENNGTWAQAAAGTAVNYSYNDSTWGDLLTAYDGQSITYDEIGNPLSYRGMSFTWQGGRQLAAVTKDGVTTSYTYNENGLRTTKTIGTETTNYYYSGDVLTGLETTGYSLYFHYDENGGIIGYTKHTETSDSEYFYVKNLQGDVLQILDSTGNTAAQYSYDAWGNILAAEGTEAAINPIRYRGYYYDIETEFYYVSSRYYGPEIGRLINADDTEYLGADGSVLSYNLFAYCMNNPINRFDVDGNWSLPNWAKVAVGAVAIAGLAVATVYSGGAAAVICGAALSGAIVGGASGAVMGAVGGGISGGWQGTLDGACSGFLSGTLIGGLTGAASAGLNIATGATTVVGNAHGLTLHRLATNMEAGNMAASGQYSQIGMNKALKIMGLNGTSRPDVIGIAKSGMNRLVEVVSPRQSTNYIINKMSSMLSNNPGSARKIVNWVRRLFK